jgi:CRP/FNR family cyclic AMP-dependent transcriptional regulator
MDSDINVVNGWWQRRANECGGKIPSDRAQVLVVELAGLTGVNKDVLVRRATASGFIAAEPTPNGEAKANGNGDNPSPVQTGNAPAPTEPISSDEPEATTVETPAENTELQPAKDPTPEPQTADASTRKTAVCTPAPIPDPRNLLTLLPKKGYTENPYFKGDVVCIPESTTDRTIHLITSGRFVTHTTEHSFKTGLELLGEDGIFGYECIAGNSKIMATCLEAGKTISWPVETLDALMRSNAMFGYEMFQMLIQKTIWLYRRIDQLAGMSIAQRLAAFLLDLAKQNGQEEEEDTVLLPPYTHDLISEFVGTSREIVTHYLNDFRNAGFIHYNRKIMRLYNRDGLMQHATNCRSVPVKAE